MEMQDDADHTHPYNGDDPVSLKKDGPKMKAWEEIGAPVNVHDIIIRSANLEFQAKIAKKIYGQY